MGEDHREEDANGSGCSRMEYIVDLAKHCGSFGKRVVKSTHMGGSRTVDSVGA